MDNIREIVLKLYQEGYSIIPSGKGDQGKSPLVLWQAYQQKQPSEEVFRSWRRNDPPLWGIVTGERSGVVIIDCDPGADQAIMDDLEPHVKTPRGGSHYWFAHPGKPVKTCAGILPKIDIRGDGGFANVVGKNPVTGGEYTIEIMPTRSSLYSWEQMPKPLSEAMEKKPVAEIDVGELRGASKVLDGVPEGERDVKLHKYACRLEGQGISYPEAVILVKAAAAACDPPFPEEKAIEKVESAYKHRIEQKAEPIKELRSLDEIEPKEVEWLWQPYLPLGKVVLLEGDPGEGKSWVSLAIASRITLGEIGGPANILIASAEDDYDDTIRPRIEEMGANIGFVYAIEEPFTLGSKKGLNDQTFEMLEKHLREKEPILLIIDPLSAYLGGGVDTNRSNETRPVMAKLASLAREYKCTILIIRHITKGGGAKPIYRGMGSIDFTAASRSVLLAGHVDREDGSVERALVQIKSNLAEKGASIGYILGHPFQWTDSTLTASEILDQPTGRGTKVDDAMMLIRDLLADGEAVPANDIFEAGKAEGISKRTMKTAKSRLKVKSGSKGEGKDKWHWYLPKEGENPPTLEPIVKDGRIKLDMEAV